MTDLATSYHEAYIKGLKFALEMVQLSDDKDGAIKQLETIIETMTNINIEGIK